MEEAEMMKIYSRYPVLVDLMQLREDSRLTSAMKDQINILEQGLQFLVLYWNILTLFNLEVDPKGKYLNFAAMIRIKATLGKMGIPQISARAMRIRRYGDWDALCSEFLDEIRSYRRLIMEDLTFFSDGLYNSCWFSINSLLDFMSRIDRSMVNALQLKGDQMIPDEKMKFESINQKLVMFRIVFNLIKESHMDFKDFHCALNAWACNAAYLCLFYWVHDDETMASYERNVMLSKLYQNFDSPHPKVTQYCLKYIEGDKLLMKERCKEDEVVSANVTRMCLSYLLATKPLADKHQETCEVIFGFVECLLWNMKAYLPSDAIEMLLEPLLFLTAFTMDPLFAMEKEGQLALSKNKESLEVGGTSITTLSSGQNDDGSTDQVFAMAKKDRSPRTRMILPVSAIRKEKLYEIRNRIISRAMVAGSDQLFAMAKKDRSPKKVRTRTITPTKRNETLYDIRTRIISRGLVKKYDAGTDQLFQVAKKSQLALSKCKEALKKAGTLIISLGSGKKDDAGIAETTNFLFHDFFDMIITIKEEVRKSHPLLFLDSSFNFPRMNVLNLFDSSIESIKEFPFYFPKHPIMTFEKELVVLRDFLKESNLKDDFVVQLQKEHLESKDLWTRISNVAYQVDRIITSNKNKSGLGIDMFFLVDVQDELKRLCPRVKRIKDKYLQESYTCRSEMNSINMGPLKFGAEETDELVVGFDNKVKEIRDWLTNESKKLDIILIIGMPGLGKTTLAKKVFNDPFVKAHFTTCAWCTVSQSYGNKKIMLDILKDITEVNDSFIEMEEEVLEDKLRKCLMGERYLIVMDDVWDVGAWNSLKLCFPENENQSRILFTSRIQDFVLDAKLDSCLYRLTELSDQESFELLEKRLFLDKHILPRNFLEYGKKIAKDCKGLPLTIVLVAGLLKKEIDSLDWWKRIGETMGSRIHIGPCSQILELSYKHLSEPLKACFLYLGLFHEDKVIQVQKLINLWVSEGFIQKDGMKDVEIIAKEYLMALVTRSLLIVNSRSSRGRIKTCRIHDLLREFCLEKAREEHFVELLPGKNVSQDTMDRHYRVSVQSQHLKHFVVRKSSPLHSIHICATGTSIAFNLIPSSFCNAVYLHVLDLEGVMFIGDFPEEISTLIFLRYLAIWCITKSIPASLGRLKNLETLRIGRLKKLETLRVIKEEEIIFPTEILEIESLRHVHIGKFSLSGMFPTMNNIQSFSAPYLNHAKHAENFLSKLKKIQKLKCRLYGLEKVINLDFLNHLVSLNLFNVGSPLYKLGFSVPSSIKKLTLSNFGLSWRELSRISKLENLEVLKILVNAFDGFFWNMEVEEQFKKLKFLKLQSLNVHIWSASHENFPCLEQIVLEHCYSLKEIPIDFVEILSLKKIQIRRCRSSLVKSAQEIGDQQSDFGNLNFKIEAVQILSGKFYMDD